MKIAEQVHRTCVEIELLYGFNPSLDEAHRQDWIHKSLKQLAHKAEPLAHERLVDVRNSMTITNLKNYETIRNDTRLEDEIATKQ